MGITFNTEAKADLRRMLLRVIGLIIGAFAVLSVFNLFSGGGDAACPENTLCTQRDMEGWLGVDLPLAAENIRFRSDPGSADLWLTFSASPLEITQFLGWLSLEPGSRAVPTTSPDWWPNDPNLTAYQATSANRTFSALVDQSNEAQWTLYLYGVAVE